MKIQVDTVILHAIIPIAFGIGRSIETGKRMAFCGDHRSIRAINQAFCVDNPSQAEVELCQILPSNPGKRFGKAKTVSTRANVVISDEEDELIFYRHSGGYPDGRLPTLNEFLALIKSNKIRDNVQQSADWLILIGARASGMSWKVGAHEPSVGIQGDIEHFFVVDPRTKTIRHCKTGWNRHSGACVPDTFYSGKFNSSPVEGSSLADRQTFFLPQ